MTRVRFSAASLRDLKQIATYIGTDSPSRARSFVDELQDACHALSDAPLRHSLLVGFEEQGLRQRPFGNYLIIYSVNGEVVMIRRVFNAAQDFAKLLANRFD